MRNILLISTITILLFTGCGLKNPQELKREPSVFTFEKVGDSNTIFKATFIKKGKHNSTMNYFIVKDVIKNIKSESKRRNYEYFQIVYPKSISNFDGFPINKEKDLAAFIAPAMSNNTSKTAFLESKKTLMDNQNSQNIVQEPLTIFQNTKVEIIVRLVKEPMEDEIVWNVNK